MARHRKKGHESSERWLVSYADLLTLLFAFFVVMFASSQTDKSRARQISRAVDKALKNSTIAEMIRGKGKAGDQAAALAKASEVAAAKSNLTSAVESLKTSLGDEIKQGQVSVHLEQRGAVISLNAQSVFPSGGDAVADSIYPLLQKVSSTLNQLSNPIRLEGHTDSLPISTPRFHSNWELSAARSIAMLRILNEKYGVARERMAIVGYGDTNAISDNSNEAGRTKNRRVDVVLLTDYGTQAEPVKRSSDRR